jgi:hypothetical protein
MIIISFDKISYNFAECCVIINDAKFLINNMSENSTHYIFEVNIGYNCFNFDNDINNHKKRKIGSPNDDIT